MKKAKRKTIRVTDLECFLLHLEDEMDSDGRINKEDFDRELAHYTAINDSTLACYNAESVSSLEMFKSVLISGRDSLKTALIINGAATIAILTFMGNVLIKGDNPNNLVSLLSTPFLKFTVGVLLSAVASGCTYLTQTLYSSSLNNTGVTFHLLSIVLIVAAYVLFAVGAYQSSEILSSIRP